MSWDLLEFVKSTKTKTKTTSYGRPSLDLDIQLMGVDIKVEETMFQQIVGCTTFNVHHEQATIDPVS